MIKQLGVRRVQTSSSGVIVIHHFLMVSFFAYTYPDRSRVGAIDDPGLFEEVFDQYIIPEVSEKISISTFRWLVVRKCVFSASE